MWARTECSFSCGRARTMSSAEKVHSPRSRHRRRAARSTSSWIAIGKNYQVIKGIVNTRVVRNAAGPPRGSPADRPGVGSAFFSIDPRRPARYRARSHPGRRNVEEGPGAMSFVHLHLHTQYSLLDGANKIAELLPRIGKAGMPACAITDHGNMFGAVQVHEAAKKAHVQPIIGCEMYVAPQSRFEKAGRIDDYEAGGNYHLILLAISREGYRHLCQLVTAGYREGFHYKPRVDKELLRELGGGLVALSGCLRGEVAHNLTNGQPERARAAAEELARIFDGRFYVEIQDNRLPAQERVNRELIALAREMGLPLVATNDCHYLRPEDAAAHAGLLCIQTGKTFSDERRWRFETDQLYVKDAAEMAAALAHVPEAVANTVEVARRCEFEFRHRQQFPVYQVPAGETPEGMLDRLARRGLDERLNERRTLGWSPERERAYDERLALELGVIPAMGYAGYFLIVAGFLNLAKDQGIPGRPGRGSAAGSLVAYALRITDLDPIEHGLLFERFLNPERKQMPDIDVDFCFVRRDEVIRYVREKYGA